jgi:hypothetical protein
MYAFLYRRQCLAVYNTTYFHIWPYRKIKVVVSMLASGTQVRGFKPGRSLLRRGSKAVCLMTQLCRMLKIPAISVEVVIVG